MTKALSNITIALDFGLMKKLDKLKIKTGLSKTRLINIAVERYVINELSRGKAANVNLLSTGDMADDSR